jgi:hypothetical protein
VEQHRPQSGRGRLQPADDGVAPADLEKRLAIVVEGENRVT